MRTILLIGVSLASAGVACVKSHAGVTERLGPSDVFTITHIAGTLTFIGTEGWARHDIFVHRSASDSEYVGTIAAFKPARSASPADFAISNDGRSIVFLHAPGLVSGHPNLERGVYQYVYGTGLKRLTPPRGSTDGRWYMVGNPPGPLPSDVMPLAAVDTVWALKATGEMSPLILLDAGPLHRAAFEGRADDCATLIKSGADIDGVTRWAHTPLDLAIIGGHTSTASRLLDLGAKPTAGMAALPLAVSLGRAHLVDTLLRRGVNAKTTDVAGNTPLHLAVNGLLRPTTLTGLMAGFEKPVSLIEKDIPAQMIRVLMDHGVDPNTRNIAGKTPIDVVSAAIQPVPAFVPVERPPLRVFNRDELDRADSSRKELYRELTTRHEYLTSIQSLLSGQGRLVQYRSPAGVDYLSQPDTGGAIERAARALNSDPRSVQRFVDLGAAQSAVRQFREAIQTYTRGLAIAPNSALLLRWRGHRYLSIREFDNALADLSRGASLDSSIYGNWYHLGIVRYARGEFAAAADAFRRAQPRAPDAGELAGSTDWLWMSLSRAGRADEARAMLARRPDSLPVANAYTRRLKLYRGEIGPDEVFTPADTADVQVATLSYGVGNWYLVRGDTARARSYFERSVKSGGWPGFGFIISEIELRRTTKPTKQQNNKTTEQQNNKTTKF